MIVAGQVQQPVKNQHLDLGGQRVPLFLALPLRRLHTDGHVACNVLCTPDEMLGAERQHIRRLVFAAKACVQVAHRRVAGQEHRHLTAQPDRGLCPRQKLRQGSRQGFCRRLPQ